MSFDPITAGLNLGKSLVDTLAKWIPDTAQRDQAAAEIAGQVNQLIAGQIELNKADSASPNKFVSYWRPAVGWVCVGSFFYAVIGYSFFNWTVLLIASFTGYVPPVLPSPDTTITLEILGGMLGLGGMRTFEKYKGITK